MARRSRHSILVLTDEEKRTLDRLRNSRTAEARQVQRAQIVWRYHVGESVSQIARALKTTRKSVLKWIDKALQMGAEAGIKDTPHKPRGAIITDDAKAWVVHLACIVLNPRIWDMRRSCGRVRLWPVTSGKVRFRRGIRPWPTQRKPPCNGYSLLKNYDPTKSNTIWNGGIRTVRTKCEPYC